MKWARRILLSTLLLVALCAGAMFLLFPREPVHEGRTLSEWLVDFSADSMDQRSKAEKAISLMGSDAVPFLVRRLESRRDDDGSSFSKWKRRFEDWFYAMTQTTPAKGRDPVREAFAGLDALGPEAKTALPALEEMLQKDPTTAQALYLVARMGPDGLPVIKRCLNSEEKLLRLNAKACVELIDNHSEILFPSHKAGPEYADISRRLTQYNLKVLQASFREHQAANPDAWVNGMPRPMLPEGMRK